MSGRTRQKRIQSRSSQLVRSRFIVVESGNEKAGQRLVEQRDLRKDWRTLFKNDSMPKIAGVSVFTDSDGTHAAVTGWNDDIVIEGQ
jgi:hypothetical protein